MSYFKKSLCIVHTGFVFSIQSLQARVPDETLFITEGIGGTPTQTERFDLCMLVNS